MRIITLSFIIAIWILPLVYLSAQEVNITVTIESLESSKQIVMDEEKGQGHKRKKKEGMSAIDAAFVVLSESEEPLHPREITKRMLERGLWHTKGKTPHDSVKARLADDIELHGRESRFCRVRPGVYAVNPSREQDTD